MVQMVQMAMFIVWTGYMCARTCERCASTALWGCVAPDIPVATAYTLRHSTSWMASPLRGRCLCALIYALCALRCSTWAPCTSVDEREGRAAQIVMGRPCPGRWCLSPGCQCVPSHRRTCGCSPSPSSSPSPSPSPPPQRQTPGPHSGTRHAPRSPPPPPAPPTTRS